MMHSDNRGAVIPALVRATKRALDAFWEFEI
jgi:hypothetical protein